MHSQAEPEQKTSFRMAFVSSASSTIFGGVIRQTRATSSTLLRNHTTIYKPAKSTNLRFRMMSDQSDQKQDTVPPIPTDMTQPTLFDKILNKEIPADVVYEDEQCLAFRDINPQAPVHVLIIPKRRIPMLSMINPTDDTDGNLIGHLMATATRIAKLEGISDDGYRVIVNNGPNGLQSVYHLHLHLIGGRKLKWGPF